MKTRLNIALAALLLSLFAGCASILNDEIESAATIPEKQAQVVLTLSVPANSLPTSTRGIADDSAIETFTLWAFDNHDGFLYSIGKNDRDEEGNPRVVIKNDKLYVLLPESETAITLSMMVNVDNLPTPAPGTAKETALNSLPTFGHDTPLMPMYGESAPFIVKEGATPGTISLKRAMAKIEVDARNAWPLFQIKSIQILYSNKNGNIVPGSAIPSTGVRIPVSGTLNSTDQVNNNFFEAYIPEAVEVNSKDAAVRTALIIEGKNKAGETLFYRLDFIKRSQVAGGSIQYEYIDRIERNHRYVFHIEHIVEGAGSNTLQDAIDKELADNRVNVDASLMVIDDENIRDITTDSQYYLGVTSSKLNATLNTDGNYYTVNMSVMTSTPSGWKIEDLPSGIEVSLQNWPDNNNEQAKSVWIYADRTRFQAGASVPIYVYSGNIRKTITIHFSE